MIIDHLFMYRSNEDRENHFYSYDDGFWDCLKIRMLFLLDKLEDGVL